MDSSLLIAVFYYDGHYYLPNCVRSVDGMIGITEPIVIVAADDHTRLAEEIELKAIAGNSTVSRADFRTMSDKGLLAAMHIANRQMFYTKAQRWSLIEHDGVFTLIPFKPAALRGIVEDVVSAVTLNPATFIKEAIEHISAQCTK
jgi:hypothetical protein